MVSCLSNREQLGFERTQPWCDPDRIGAVWTVLKRNNFCNATIHVFLFTLYRSKNCETKQKPIWYSVNIALMFYQSMAVQEFEIETFS